MDIQTEQPGRHLFAAGPRIVEEIPDPVDRDEVVRYLGYPRGANPATRIVDVLDCWIGEAARRAAPRASYRVFPVTDRSRRSIRLSTARGPVEFRGAIGAFLGPVDAVALFIATAGAGVEHLAAELLCAGDTLAGLVVNAVGSERAEAAEAVVLERLGAQAAFTGRKVTLPYSPGYCGMALTEQRRLFDTLSGEPIGVRLSADCLMTPLKSISGLVGLGPRELIELQGSPCERCGLRHCNMRR